MSDKSGVSWDRRDLKMSRQWTESLSQYIKDEISDLSEYDILDYGCSYFTLGYQLLDHVRSATGYDPHEMAIEVARRSPQNSEQVVLTSSSEAVGGRDYDLIVINSVIQYMDSLAEVGATLERLKTLLKVPGTSRIIVSDIIPRRYSPYLDGIENLIYATFHGIAPQMLKHLSTVALKGSGYTLLRIEPAEMRSQAKISGFDIEFLKRNLTPSRRRYSIILS